MAFRFFRPSIEEGREVIRHIILQRCAPEQATERAAVLADRTVIPVRAGRAVTAVRADTVVATGLTTSGCVRASATGALNHDFVPVVVRDATGDRDATTHEATLFDLGQKYAEVVDAAAAHRMLATFGWRS